MSNVSLDVIGVIIELRRYVDLDHTLIHTIAYN